MNNLVYIFCKIGCVVLKVGNLHFDITNLLQCSKKAVLISSSNLSSAGLWC